MKKGTDRELQDLALLIKKEINEKKLNLSEEGRENIYNRVVSDLKENELFKTLPKEKQKQLIYEILIDDKNIFAFNIRETFLKTFKTDYLVFQKLIFDLFARIDYHEYFCTKNDSPSIKQDKCNKLKKISIFLNKTKQLYPHLNCSQMYACIQFSISENSEFSSVRKSNVKRLNKKSQM